MLVPTRKAGEAIRVGKDIEIGVQEVGGGRVKCGIEAPKMICVRRSELLGTPAKVVGRTIQVRDNTDWATSRRTVGLLNNLHESAEARQCESL